MKIFLLLLGALLEPSFSCTEIEIGRFTITCEMFELRKKVDQLYGREVKSEERFIAAYKKGAILEKLVGEISPAVLEKEARRIETNSKDPERLKKIRSLFKDQNLYQRVYVYPVFCESEILKIYQIDPRISKKVSYEKWLDQELDRIPTKKYQK